MSEEDLVLAVFLVLPLLLLALFLWCARSDTSAKSERNKKIQLVAGNFLFFLFLLSSSLLGAELYYRFVYDTTDSFALTKTSIRWFNRYYQFNSRDVRDNTDDYESKIRPDRQRVTFFGDSFTVGHGIKDVDDRFANRYRKDHPSIEVHVFARNGADTGDELFTARFLSDQGYDFSRVVLVYNLNDVSDIVPERQRISRIIFIENRPGWLASHSYFINMIYYRLLFFREPEIANYYHFVKQGYDGPLWQQQMLRLKAFKGIVEGRGGRLFVVTFPFLHALGPEYAFGEVHRKLDAFWSSLGVPHLDLYELYSGYRPQDLVVNAHDAHPNERAHTLASQAISNFLVLHTK